MSKPIFPGEAGGSRCLRVNHGAGPLVWVSVSLKVWNLSHSLLDEWAKCLFCGSGEIHANRTCMPGEYQEPIREIHDRLPTMKPLKPCFWNSRCPVVCPCEPAVDRRCRIDIIAEVDGPQASIPKIVRAISPTANPAIS